MTFIDFLQESEVLEAVVKQIANIMPTKTRENPNQGRVYDISGIAPSLNCMGGGGREPRIAIPCLTPDRLNKRQNGRRFKNNNDPMFTLTAQDKHGVVVGGIYTNDSLDYHRGILEGKSRCLKGNKSDAGVVFIKTATKKGYDIARINEDSINLTFPNSKTRRGRVGRGKAQTLDASCNQGVAINDSECNIRKLTPLECWRLQGWDEWGRANLPDWDMGGTYESIDDNIMKLCKVYDRARCSCAMFDSRVFSIPKDEVCNCLIWRQQDATRNSIEAAGQSYFSHKQLMNKSCNDIQEMLFQEHGINWNDYPNAFKRGSACYRVCGEEKVANKATGENKTVTRSRWVVDENIPIFTQDRDFVERWIDFE